MDSIASFLKSMKPENMLLIAGIFLGSILACARLEKTSPKQVAKELALSYLAALIMYGICRAFGANDWLTMSLVSTTSYFGSKTLPFFKWLFQSSAVKVTEKTLGIDLDDDEGMKQ